MRAIFKDFLHLCEFHMKLTINRTSTKREITVIGTIQQIEISLVFSVIHLLGGRIG